MGGFRPDEEQKKPDSAAEGAPRDTRLSPDDAMDEFLMIQAELGIDAGGKMAVYDPKLGGTRRVEVTAADIDRADKAVSELVRLAEEETDTKRLLLAIGRTLNDAGLVAGKILAGILYGYDAVYDNLTGARAPHTRMVFKEVSIGAEDAHRRIAERLKSARGTLGEFKDFAIRRGKYRAQGEPNLRQELKK